MKKTCSLCGGKLDRNHRCLECGLDNTKNDNRYEGRLNKNVCDSLPMTHIHEGNRARPVSHHQKTQPKKQQKGSKIARNIVAGVIVLNLVSAIFPLIGDVRQDITQEFSDMGGMYIGEMFEDDIYAYAAYDIPEDGEAYKTTLGPGIYKVGVHIPEGTYSVTGDTLNWFDVIDKENQIYHSFDIEGEENVAEDVRLYQGAFLKVPISMEFQFFSENAQIEKMVTQENPLTDAVAVTETMTAGTDFPAGMYDVLYVPNSEEEYGNMDYVISLDIEDGVSQLETLYFDAGYGETVYKNIVFPEGSTLTLKYIEKVTLVPSAMIENTDYAGYYDNYM